MISSHGSYGTRGEQIVERPGRVMRSLELSYSGVGVSCLVAVRGHAAGLVRQSSRCAYESVGAHGWR